MKTMYLKRLFKHLFVFQIISLHRALDVIFMILFPRIWIKRVSLYQRERSVYQKTFSSPIGRVVALLVSLLFSYLTVTPAFGQEPVGQSISKRLYVGDLVPEELWNLPLKVVNHPDSKEVITLNEYRSKKLIIIDFWSTWCKSCLQKMPDFLTLGESYGDKVGFLLASQQDSLADHYLKNNNINSFSIVTIKESLGRYFPHAWLPYYVWISDGKVIASTGSNEITKQSLDLFLVGNKAPSEIRQDRVDFKLSNLLLNDKLILKDRVIDYSFTITGYLKDVKGQTNYTVANDSELSYYATVNSDLFNIYRSVISIDRPDLRNANFFVLETAWKEKLKNIEQDYIFKRDLSNFFSIQFFSYASSKNELRQQLLDQINVYFGNRYGVVGEVQNRERAAYVLRKIAPIGSNKLAKKDIEGVYLNDLLLKLNYRSEILQNFIPWINQAGAIDQEIAIPRNFSIHSKDVKDLNEIFNPQGYKVTLESIPMDVFVVRDLLTTKGGAK